MKIHIDERPHKCDECGCAFIRKEHLKIHKFFYHTAEGQQQRKREEVIVEKFLKKHGFDFKREHRISFTCLGRTFASIDFMLIINGVVIFLEVDERQHEHYGVDCDVKRMADVFGSLLLEGNELPIVFIRYNPHGFKVEGKTRRTTKKQRHDKLLETIKLASQSKKKAVFYLFYNQDSKGVPNIVSDPLYDSTMKELVV
jgi:hypothetical protein